MLNQLNHFNRLLFWADFIFKMHGKCIFFKVLFHNVEILMSRTPIDGGYLS